jgi:hypothetical protein
MSNGDVDVYFKDVVRFMAAVAALPQVTGAVRSKLSPPL